jgi:hypothetical protein
LLRDIGTCRAVTLAVATRAGCRDDWLGTRQAGDYVVVEIEVGLDELRRQRAHPLA